ncbi:MAG TPA: YciI family protein [Devosiaceae bacterium]|jgi:hypothetical protein|nr:YciI family protein [Devosiaceae bacterium]
MKYVLLIHGDEARMTEGRPPDADMSAEFAAYNEALRKSGVMLASERLRPTSSATSIRVKDGKTELLDGPYAETKEQLGGFYMIDVPDLDQALAWAARCPAARTGTIEVRPIWPTDGADGTRRGGEGG